MNDLTPIRIHVLLIYIHNYNIYIFIETLSLLHYINSQVTWDMNRIIGHKVVVKSNNNLKSYCTYKDSLG